MANARETAIAANNNYFNVLKEAQNQFNQVKELFPQQTFWQWSAANYPPLAAADRTRRSAQTELYQAMQQYFGPDAAVLSTYMENTINAQSANTLPGYPFSIFPSVKKLTRALLSYNQDGLVDDQDLINLAIRYANSGERVDPAPIQQSTIRVPAYTIQAYSSTVQAWIAASAQGATRDQVLTIDINQGESTTWQDYGFEEVNGGGHSGFWPFFSADVYLNNRWETRTLKTSGRETDISLQLSMIGVGKFDVQAGLWWAVQHLLLFFFS